DAAEPRAALRLLGRVSQGAPRDRRGGGRADRQEALRRGTRARRRRRRRRCDRGGPRALRRGDGRRSREGDEDFAHADGDAAVKKKRTPRRNRKGGSPGPKRLTKKTGDPSSLPDRGRSEARAQLGPL